MKIGVLSDTHGFLDDKLLDFFKECDEIWHAGDVGAIEITDSLERYKPLVAVYGNIDGTQVRAQYPEMQKHNRAGLTIWMIHIGGYPGRYERKVREMLISGSPDLLITGHSHILKVLYDKKYKLLHINPGAAGRNGLHKVRTAVRFDINDKKPTNLEIIELGPRSSGTKKQ